MTATSRLTNREPSRDAYWWLTDPDPAADQWETKWAERIAKNRRRVEAACTGTLWVGTADIERGWRR